MLIECFLGLHRGIMMHSVHLELEGSEFIGGYYLLTNNECQLFIDKKYERELLNVYNITRPMTSGDYK